MHEDRFESTERWNHYVAPPRLVTDDSLTGKIREICEGLTGVTIVEDRWPSYAVGKKVFARYEDNHHGDGKVVLTCKFDRAFRDQLVESDPDRYFVPPYVGHHGWLGIRLEGDPDWDAIAGHLADSHATVAPKRKRL